MFRRLCFALGLLSGCSTKQPVHSEPGTSIPLSYPVVLVGQNDVAARDDMKSLVSASMSSGMSFTERKIVEASGAIFEVRSATVVGDAKAWWSDMGTSQRSHFLELVKTRASGLAAAQKLVLEQVESPQSVWEGNPKATARVKSFASIAELIDGCRRSWEWAQ